MKATICIGISASGKSTFTRDKLYKENIPSNPKLVEMNYDNIREDICQQKNSLYIRPKDNLWYFWKNKWEKEVSKIFEEKLVLAISNKQDLIFSNLNLHKKNRESLIERLKKEGYEIEIIEFDITYEESVRRDLNRKNSLGANVIRKQWQMWLEYLKEKGVAYHYQANRNLPKAVIFDIDGTIAHMNGQRTPYEWDKVKLDNPDIMMKIMISGLIKEDYKIIFLSGRDGICYNYTKEWILKHFSKVVFEDYFYGNEWVDEELYKKNSFLFMRKENDQRKDSIVKMELFLEHVKDNFNVEAVFDDRPQVVRVWQDIGLKVWATGDQLIEF